LDIFAARVRLLVDLGEERALLRVCFLGQLVVDEERLVPLVGRDGVERSDVGGRGHADLVQPVVRPDAVGDRQVDDDCDETDREIPDAPS